MKPKVVKGEDVICFSVTTGYPKEKESLGSYLERCRPSGTDFKPLFAYQLFTDDSNIYGYSKLKISIILHSPTYLACMEYSYASKDEGATDFVTILKD